VVGSGEKMMHIGVVIMHELYNKEAAVDIK